MTTEAQDRVTAIAHNQPPFAQWLGLKVTHVEADRIEAQTTVTPEMANRNGVMHGGAVSGLIDNVGGTASFINLGEGEGTSTVESKTNFFRPISIGDTIRVIAEPLHKGRKTHVWQIKVLRGDGKLAAIGTQTQIILDKFER
ncbi:PaaI family thioesterase [Tianweitania sediminis]|uniref:PaaI family thioesterase n=1 Tax=Tianweitania sediminis TaxID=1502156 RepID=A0A8J7R3M5_9HYPH|nr:PaaI family thioesterase [Tianweitania sediminis]MBP0441167.1 PaaI family thioesterase [Tianweitania sediminis]